VCPVLHELQGDGVCRDWAQARGASRPASKFVDGGERLATGVREVDGIDRRWQSLNGFTCKKAKALPISLAEVPTLHRMAVERNFVSRWLYERGPVL